MEYVPLATTGRNTSRLGFGCTFGPGTRSSEAMKLLTTAYDAGVRHFDVAPSYGSGVSELYLGTFLRTCAADVTVTTKYGILPLSRRYLWLTSVRRSFGPLVRQLRRLPSMDQRIARTVTEAFTATKAAFSRTQAANSLEQSLRRLRLEKLDLFLMHEPTVDDLGDDRLLSFLEESVTSGRIGAFGIGGDSSRLPSLYAERARFCRVMQFDWSIFSTKTDYPGSFRIHFQTFSKHAPALHSLLLRQPELCRRWSDYVDADLANERIIRNLMLKAALASYPNSIVLFSSGKIDNITGNVRVAEDASLTEKSLRFCYLVEQEHQVLGF
jgi:D-threo-aldose 1-dehydrogenase